MKKIIFWLVNNNQTIKVKIYGTNNKKCEIVCKRQSQTSITIKSLFTVSDVNKARKKVAG